MNKVVIIIVVFKNTLNNSKYDSFIYLYKVNC